MGTIRDLIFIIFIAVAVILYLVLDEDNKKNLANATLGGIAGGLIGFLVGQT